MPLTVGTIQVPIFARFNGEDTELGTITVPVKINAGSAIREAQAALDGEPVPDMPQPELSTPAKPPASKPLANPAQAGLHG